jgi:hypothetical protein
MAEVVPPVGWRADTDESVSPFVTICYGNDCASTDAGDPDSLDDLRDRHERDVDNSLGNKPAPDEMSDKDKLADALAGLNLESSDQ